MKRGRFTPSGRLTQRSAYLPYVYDVVVIKKFTFAILSPGEFLVYFANVSYF